MPSCASFFAGVGGIDRGFENTGFFNTIYANEFDSFPARTFELNFPNIHVDVRSINDVKADEIPDFDIMLAGFPCQAFSIAGYRQGFDDERGRGLLFFELIRLIKEKPERHRPHVLFLENVKNLQSHNNGETFQVILQALQDIGYYPKYQVLNAKDYGNVPQNRERIYIVAFDNEQDRDNFNFPEPIELTRNLEDIIDFEHPVDERYYYTPGKYQGDIYDRLAEAMQNDNPNDRSIYQWRRHYVRKNQSHVVPTLTANQGTGGHNVCLIKTNDGRIRKMTPHECFNTQGFPENFVLPNDMAESRLYKQAGNSVCVSVIQRIAEQIQAVWHW